MSAIHEWFGYYHAMFRYLERTYGPAEMEEYFRYLAREAYSDVTERYREKGLEAVRDRYVANFRRDGDDSSATGTLEADVLTMEVRCPAFSHGTPAKHPDRAVTPDLCRYCRQLNEAILKEAGIDLQLQITAPGHCTWTCKQTDI